MQRLRIMPRSAFATKTSPRVVGVTTSASNVLFCFSLMIEVAGKKMPPMSTAMSTMNGSNRSLQGILTSSPKVTDSISTGTSWPPSSLTRSATVTDNTVRFFARLSPHT